MTDQNDQTESQGIPDPDGPANVIETDYTIGQDNIQGSVGPFGLDIHNPVFVISGLSVVAFVIYTLALQDVAGDQFNALRGWLTETLDWFFLSAANIFVLFCLFLIVTPLGSVRLGGRDAVPDYSYTGWFAMLFAAGMGIGLMFFGVSEPISHYNSSVGGTSYGVVYSGEEVPADSPNYAAVEAAKATSGATVAEVQAKIAEIPEDIRADFAPGGRTDWAPLGAAAGDKEEAARLSMAATIFHWGLHPWAIYAVVALALALFSFNKGLPLTMRSVFYPIFGERVWGWTGHVIDTLAVFATLFGLATSLGFGAEQVASGLTHLFGEGDPMEGTRTIFGAPYANHPDSGVENDRTILVILITVITAIALISVYRGLDGGVKVLSEINMGLAALLMLFVILAGPTLAILTGFGSNLMAYVEDLPALSNPVGREDANFAQGWTSFYWAWWISWSPFVGMFIARVSRGRTVREFVICVLLIPSIVCVLWMSAFGGTALLQIIDDGVTKVAEAPLELKLFLMLEELPLAFISSMIGIVLVVVFFVTSSDSGSLVIDTITAGGKVDAPMPQRMFWCTFEGLVAIALLLGGGLGALQAMAVSTGFPFTIVLLLACWAILKGLWSEPR